MKLKFEAYLLSHIRKPGERPKKRNSPGNLGTKDKTPRARLCCLHTQAFTTQTLAVQRHKASVDRISPSASAHTLYLLYKRCSKNVQRQKKHQVLRTVPYSLKLHFSLSHSWRLQTRGSCFSLWVHVLVRSQAAALAPSLLSLSPS